MAAIAGLADLPDQSCRWYRGNRPLRAADDNVPAALLPCDSASRTSTVGVVRGDDKSDRGVDFAPDYRVVPLGQCTSLSYSGPGHCVWRGLQAALACHGHSGQADCSPIAVAEPVRRETDRYDPTVMSRSHDRIWGGAPAPDPGPVCRGMDGVRIPTLMEVFDLARQAKADHVRFNIETKLSPTSGADTPDPETFAAAVVRWRTLVIMRRVAPEIERVCLTIDGGNG